MTTLPLRMRYATTALRPAAAWLVPGRDAREWLDELVQWGVPLTAVTLYAVPRRPGEGTAAGVLAIPAAASGPTGSRRCQPYGRIGAGRPAGATAGGAIYLPVEARIDPDATDAELAAVLAPGAGVCLLHPAIGLVRFLETDARRVADLLRPAPAKDAAWDVAVAGVFLSPRLLSIEPASVPSLEMVLGGGRDEIASRRPAVDALPPSPEEPAAGVFGRPGRAVQRQIARVVSWMASRKSAPGGAAKPGRLGQWAQRQLAELDRALLAGRHREILRLLHLLQTDPEQGLRYALPMGSGSHRGIAPPGGRLVDRDIDFDLRRLAGGEPADPWDLPLNFQARLTSMYYELATREIQLGRHRRAAYIYAELLGNLEMAAGALKAGGHFREAAVLYRERLGRPDEAARCLEQGGLWTEAIALHVELENFETAGDIYAQLEQTDQAREAYGLAVSRHYTHQDYLAAARILEAKLADCDGAVVCLEAGWPASRQAGQCLAELFRLLGRHGWHEAAHKKVAALRQTAPEGTVAATEILSRLALDYPDRAVQTDAADATRTIAARRLPAASHAESLSVLGAVRRLVPEDRLLGRDCDRFGQSRSLPQAPRLPAPRPSQPKRPAAELTLLHTIKLPENVEWRTAISARGVFYAAGYERNRIVVVQGFWDGNVRVASGIEWPPAPAHRPPILLACGQRRHPVLVRALGGPALRWQWFPRADELRYRIEVGTPPWLPDGAVGLHRTDHGESSMLVAGDTGLILSSYNLRDELLGSRTLAWSEVWPEGNGCYELPAFRPVPFYLQDHTAYLGLEDRLVVWRPPGRARLVHVGDAIVGLHRSAPFSRARVAVALQQGAVLCWDDFQAHTTPFAEDLAAPVLQFVDGGWLVAASEQECRVYRTAENHQVRWNAHLPHRHGRPIAVLARGQHGQFALATQDGTVAVYQVPAG